MSDLIGTDDPFSAADKAALRELLGSMIPAQDERPGADDPLIFADFLRTVRPHVELMHEVVRFASSSSLEALSQSKASPVSALVSFAVQCYYRDDRVMAALDMEVRAPHPDGYALEEGDWSLLEPVRGRGKIYRDA